MKCPDCGTRLSEVKLEGDSWVHRCFKCGGFWIDSWSVNRLDSKTLSSWRRIGVDKQWISGGKGICPQDGMLLQRYRGESVPQNLALSRCVRCGKWWFPGDSLFDYKPAIEAKISYFSSWGLTGDLTGLALPILSIAVMIMTLGLAINYARIRQQPVIQAETGIRKVNFTYLGDGRLMLNFVANQEVTNIWFREVGAPDWVIMTTQKDNDLYKVILEGLESGKEYQFKVGDREVFYKVGGW